ncbi:MAG: TatD family hydrolase [Bacteroidota bacterium]
MTKSYINIHTHHLSKDDGVFLFNNRFGFDQDLFLDRFFSVGIHPWDSGLNISTSDLEKLIQHQNCLAIGECGLDKLIDIDLELQKIVFKDQLELALKFEKPVIIHCVKAFDEVMEVCKPYHSQIPLIIHGFNKSLQLAKQLIDNGFYLSLSSTVFKKEDFDFGDIPIEKIFLETDDKDSISIRDIYKIAAQYLKIDEEQLKEKIYSNFTTLFIDHGR